MTETSSLSLIADSETNELSLAPGTAMNEGELIVAKVG